MDVNLSTSVRLEELPPPAQRERLPTPRRSDLSALPALFHDPWMRRLPAHQSAVPGFDALWVSTIGGEVVGVIGVVRAAQHVAAVARFRVDPQWQHTAVVLQLLRQVHEYCEKLGCLRVIVESGAMPGWMFHVMDRCGFLFSRRRQHAGGQQWEFYLDLNRRPCDERCTDSGVAVAAARREQRK